MEFKNCSNNPEKDKKAKTERSQTLENKWKTKTKVRRKP